MTATSNTGPGGREALSHLMPSISTGSGTVVARKGPRVLGAVIGALIVSERVPGALVGGFLGLLVGLFGSGFFLMVYRGLRHLRGRHD